MSTATTYFVALKAFVVALLAGSSVAAAQSATETEAWRAAQVADTGQAYAQFLRDHPKSVYAEEAFRAMVAEAVARANPEFFPEGPTVGRAVSRGPGGLLAQMY